jgi:hypothetical protein
MYVYTHVIKVSRCVYTDIHVLSTRVYIYIFLYFITILIFIFNSKQIRAELQRTREELKCAVKRAPLVSITTAWEDERLV